MAIYGSLLLAAHLAYLARLLCLAVPDDLAPAAAIFPARASKGFRAFPHLFHGLDGLDLSEDQWAILDTGGRVAVLYVITAAGTLLRLDYEARGRFAAERYKEG